MWKRWQAASSLREIEGHFDCDSSKKIPII